MDEPITKRLHVSGLTPAITPDDLAKRFGSFGDVKAMDGFGLMDAVGQPRKFGYVTLETTKKNLSRCKFSSILCSALVLPLRTLLEMMGRHEPT